MSLRGRLGGACTGAGVLLALAGPSMAASTRLAVHERQASTGSWGGTQIQSLDPVTGADLRAAARPGYGGVGADLGLAARQAASAGEQQVLSDERTVTRWAYVNQTETIYEQPTTSSAPVTRLRWSTPDGFPQTYLLLEARWDAQGREWVKLRIPMRPNGRTGWVPRDALGAFYLTRLLLVVDRQRLRISLYRSGQLVWSAPVAVGKPSTPTPPGWFWITERFKIENASSGYWPYAFGTSAYSTLTDWPGGGVVGIHGPYYEPQLIPGRVSHGCVRLRVADDEWLAHHITLGTPVHIL